MSALGHHLASGQAHDAAVLGARVRSRRVSLRVSMLAIATGASALQVLRQRARRTEVAGQQRQVLDDQAGGMDLVGFDVLGLTP
jgi:hypothetical protein